MDHPFSWGKSVKISDDARFAVVVKPDGHHHTVDMALLNHKYKLHITLNNSEDILNSDGFTLNAVTDYHDLVTDPIENLPFLKGWHQGQAPSEESK